MKLALLLLAAIALSLAPFSWQSDQVWNPFMDERLPRTLLLVMTGASLAAAGAVMQALFQNPLASESVLGITSGGTLAAVLIFLTNGHLSFPWLIPVGTVLGCLGTLLFVWSLASSRQSILLGHLILTGLAVTTLLIAVQGVITYMMRDNWQIYQILTEMEAGTTLNKGWRHFHMQFPLTLVGLSGIFYYRREINLLSLGAEEAMNLGVDVYKVRFRLFLFVASLTGGALAAIGNVGFFGLMMPHIARKLSGPNHLTLIPLSAWLGMISLLLLDTLIRHLAIYSLSLGNICALFGGLFFLFLLMNRKMVPACP
ncbi:MAG: iron ABC transporter permease [Chlamydiia bacterium]|nr:iron ABC transporter permease [Chlamydiia bacterium]